MKNLTAVVGAGIAALAFGLTAVSCSSATKTEDKASTAVSASPATTTAEATTSAPPAGANKTLDEYINENKLQKTVIRPGDPAPKIDLPVPAGWENVDASADAPYGGLVFSQPVSPNDSPRINKSLFKLTGKVDTAQVFDLAPADLQNRPGYESFGDPNKDELGGFEAVQAGGGYTKNGNLRLIAQKTVVIPAPDGVFVFQLTADGLESDMETLMDATTAIDDGTKITSQP
jgi:hypothetical protein